MKKYKYTAVNLNKEKFSGTFIAKDEHDLAKQLSKQDLFLVSCSAYNDGSPSAFFTLGTGKITVEELTTFCRQFAIMIDAGIPVLECLECLRVQTFSAYFKSLLNVIYDDVKSGIMLSAAVEKHKKAFPDFFRSMLYVGEVSGKLDMVLNALADYYEKDNAIKKKTVSALSYPAMLIGLVVLVALAMLFLIVPTFRKSLDNMPNITYNALTTAIFNTSEFMITNWKYLLVGLIVVIAAIVAFCLTPFGKRTLDRWKVTLPIVKDISISIITARFCRSFALLLASGLDISEAMESAKVIIGNRFMQAKFAKAAEEVRHGVKLAEAFEKHHLFPEVMLQMVTIGERTAALDNVLSRSANYFDEQVESTLTSTVNRIQPIILIIMGVVIGGMFIAVYSPMISIMTSL